MPLAALIIANDKMEEASTESLAILGQPLVEYQCRLAAAAGATHLTICADKLPGRLVGVLDRLRGEGLVVAFARTAAEAADTVHPEEPVLLLARGAVASVDLLNRFAESDGALLLVVPNEVGTERLELIDAEHRWAGIARIDGAQVRQTAGLLGEWSLAETLLRMAVQARARRHVHAPQEDGAAGIATTDHNLQELALSQIQLAPVISGTGWLARPLASTARIAASFAAKMGIPAPVLAWLAPAMAAGALIAGIAGWSLAALLLTAGALLPADVSNRMLAVTQLAPRRLGFYLKWREVAGSLVILLAGWFAYGTRGWECLILACWCVWTLASQPQRKGTAESSALLIAAGYLAGWPIFGFVVALCHLLLPAIRTLEFQKNNA